MNTCDFSTKITEFHRTFTQSNCVIIQPNDMQILFKIESLFLALHNGLFETLKLLVNKSTFAIIKILIK